jgi:alpha-beta hydrolase superfamily lysophospholipase
MRLLLRKILWRTGRFLLLLYLGLGVFGWFAAERMIFQPQPATYGVALPGLRTVRAADGTPLAVAHLPNPAARHTVFYFHGNAEDLGDTAPLLEAMQAAGFAVLAFDYRGYGRSGGHATEQNVYDDTREVFAHARATLGLKPESTIVVGRSVGGGPAVEFAARERVAGLVLISPFTSAFRVLTHVSILPFDRFDNLAKIGRVRAPVLVFHGTEDAVIPFAHGQKLFAAAPEPKRASWIEGAGHNDLLEMAGERILRELTGFGHNLPRPP